MVINTLKKIKPMQTNILTTMEEYSDAELLSPSGLIDTTKTTKSVKEYQTVLAIGPFVRDINVGDVVCINPKAYARKKYQDGSMKDGIVAQNTTTSYEFNTLIIDNTPCLMITDRDIDFVVEEYE